ncbi:methylmalonyl-CoA mutase family protein [Crateriforma conspicua]|uniref:Methylmalonyl-CoA mutase small subunit n=1 Tax=Crateriforma conspicua TaxID=2527996 RepID=A0A5C6FSK5_9PLAN|nr:methylmalonyl-CoA mutase family protein [Crateriforma conspicua]TWU65869.1 Methylmalonyl-CoA mutase small subunit [Crateriforma conspicua]
MTTSKLTVTDDFPPVDYDTWRQQVESDLKGAPFDRKLVSHTYEGIDIQPVYSSKDQLDGTDPLGVPGAVPFTRGAHPMGPIMCGVDQRQEHTHPDLEAANQAILGDLEGGVTSLTLRLDKATRAGVSVEQAEDLAGVDGLMAYRVEDLDELLEKVHLELIEIGIDAGASYLPAAATLAALWNKRGVPGEAARASFGADPLATLAADGRLPMSMGQAYRQMAELVRWTKANYPKSTAICVNTAVYHNAGATAAQDIAFALATAVDYLRGLESEDVAIDDAVSQMLFRFSIGTHHFLAIAKLRAARSLWSRVLQACGAAPRGMRIHTRTSDRVMTQRDPYVNMLRNTVASFAGIVGGAEIVTSVPFDEASGLPNAFSRRIARNTVLILQEESHMHRVLDASGGSWFMDDLTTELCEKAWEIFQGIEKAGGMAAALQSGAIAEQIDAAYAPRAKDIAKRREGITGVSEFPNLTEEPVKHSPPDMDALLAGAKKRVAATAPTADAIDGDDRLAQCVAAAEQGATIAALAQRLGLQQESTDAKVIEPHAFAQPFEELRDASDAWMEKHGNRPRVFLANMGPVAHHTARATYAKNFFEAGGFEAVTNEGFADADAATAAFKESGANVAVICSSDKLYPDMVPPVAGGLKAAGAKTVVLAGHPGDNEAAWRQAGVDRFIFIKCDVLATLRELLREEEVLS